MSVDTQFCIRDLNLPLHIILKKKLEIENKAKKKKPKREENPRK